MTTPLASIHTTTPDPAINFVYEQISTQLDQGHHVLWLIPGGSVIPLAVTIMQKLQAHPLNSLFITLTDERFGPINHPDENYHQLQAAGFDPGPATWYRPNSHQNIEIATTQWGSILQQQLDQADYKIGLFGIGPDGHTAGLLPGTSSLDVTSLTTHFQGHDFPRLTTTAKLIQQLDSAVAYALGDNKWPQIQRLLSEDLSIKDQPAQILKKTKHFTLFTDLPSNTKSSA